MNGEEFISKQSLRKHWLSVVLKEYPVLSGYFIVIILIKLIFTVRTIFGIPLNYYLWYLEVLRETGKFLLYPVAMLLALHLVSQHKTLVIFLMIIPIALPVIQIVGKPKTLNYAQKIRCTGNLRKIADSCIAYAADHHGYYPPSLEKLVELKYLDIEVLHCPGNRWHNPGENDYLYWGSGVRQGKEPSEKILVQDKPSNHVPGKYGTKLHFDDQFISLDKK